MMNDCRTYLLCVADDICTACGFFYFSVDSIEASSVATIILIGVNV